MRYMPDKTAIIIDHVGNCYLHGLPDDNREWTLEPKAKQANMVKIRECPMCFSVYPPTKQKCPYCGYAAVKEIQRKDKEVVEIDLVEMQRQEDIKNTKYSDLTAESWSDVERIRKTRGYKIQWAVRFAVLHDIAVPHKYDNMRRIIGV